MKKLIAMILALVATLSLCACGSKDTTQNTEQSKQIATENEEVQSQESKIPNLDMFVGQWRIVDEDQDLTFTVNADGTLEQDGKTLTWTVRQAHPDREYEMILTAEHPADPSFPDSSPFFAFELYLTRTPENTYVAELMKSEMATRGDQYYRPCDYEVVALTVDNVLEYLQCDEYYTFRAFPDALTKYELYRYTEISFKEGVGVPSHCYGDLSYHVTLVSVMMDANGYTEGEIVDSYDLRGGTQLTRFSLNTSYPYQFYYDYSLWGAAGSDDLHEAQKILHHELIGAQEITGYVYIPVK